jgi:TPR repeat protein
MSSESFPCLYCDAPVPDGDRAGPAVCPACGRAQVACERYRVHGLLGKGGMGKVYAARREPDGEEVAVKVLVPRESSDWMAWELFERSSTVLRGLSHPALPKVYAFARAEPARLILVRAAYDGGTLQERIEEQQRRLEPGQVRALLVKLLELLAYLAELVPPVVHRDIKPANIMFRSPEDWDPVLVDFDTVAAPRGLGSGLTIVGTPGYAAPEQFAGDATPSSDLYSLGATMLFVVTHLDADAIPRRDGRLCPGELLDEVDEPLRRVLLAMVEPDRHARPASARAVLAALEARSVAAAPPPGAGGAAPAAPAATGPIGVVVGKHGGAVHGGVEGYAKDDYIGRVSHGALVRLLDHRIYKNEFGLDIIQIKVLKNEWSRELGATCWVNLAATSFRDHVDEQARRIEEHVPDEAPEPAPPPPAPAKSGRGWPRGILGMAVGIVILTLIFGNAICGGGSRSAKKRATRTTTKPAAAKVDAAVEKERRECEAGVVASCFALGARYDRGRGVTVDQTRAVGLYERACDGRHLDACNDLGVMHVKGTGVAENAARGAELYRRACEGGVALSCRNLGNLYVQGTGVAKDEARAAELFQRACTIGDMSACTNLGYSYDRGRGVKLDHTRAADLYSRACDGGDLVGCKNLGLSYFEGEGVARDEARAVGLFRRGCDGDDYDACRHLGRAYAAGRGVVVDRAEALELLRKACRNRVEEACPERDRLGDAGAGK